MSSPDIPDQKTPYGQVRVDPLQSRIQKPNPLPRSRVSGGGGSGNLSTALTGSEKPRYDQEMILNMLRQGGGGYQ